jgi:hypothetical protein
VHFVDIAIGTRDWLIYKSNGLLNKTSQLLKWWNGLDYKWKKLIYLNYRLSNEEINLRISTFLDGSYGLEFIMVEVFKLESDNHDDALIKLDKYVKSQILKIDDNIIRSMLQIEELCIEDVNTLKPLEYFPKLKLVYLDHCKSQDINYLNNLNRLQFYESPEYPTNTPSLYFNSDAFNESVKIIKNPFEAVHIYFDEKLT